MSTHSAMLCSIFALSSIGFVGCQFRDDAAKQPGREERVGDVSLDQGHLVVDGAVFDIKGICWNPVPKGQKHPEGLAFRENGPAYDLDFVERDLKLIAEAGFNTLRIYKVITDRKTLERIEFYGLKVIVPIFNFHSITNEEIEASVLALKDHSTTLFWEIGNEWNYNHLYNPEESFENTLTRIQEVIRLVRSIDERIPIATNYGELPAKEVEQRLDVDVWGLNIYQSASFGTTFERWRALSDKPMYIGEYGADAIDNRKGDGRYAPEEQAYAAETLTQQIISQYASAGKGPALGGCLFEFSDEWWKDYSGEPNEHDVGGIAPGGGPYPDDEFNEEWWGIVDIDRNPRAAYDAMKGIYGP